MFHLEDKLLLPFEREHVPKHYLPYYQAKRSNFFASVQSSPRLWQYYQLLDKILIDEFGDMNAAHDPNRMFPLALFFNAHAKIRVSLELAFSHCMEEARSILRDAIETAAFAHYMLNDPTLQTTWLNKDEDQDSAKAFTQAFEKDKKTQLFNGLAGLYTQWGRMSETGSHSTPQAIVTRFKMIETSASVQYRMNYTGVEDREWEPETLTLLFTVSQIEQVVFEDFKSRLMFDETLSQNRARAARLGVELRQQMIAKHDIKPPKQKT
jgi:hypothetical protein